MAGEKIVYWHWFLESWPANAMSIREVFIIIFIVIIIGRKAITKFRLLKICSQESCNN